jgi:Ca-activated chloride channel family protein
LEDGREQEIRLFSSEDSPLSVALILDVSGSMANKISIERDAVAEFSRNAHPEDEYIGIAVADKPMLMAESSRGIDEIQTKLATVEPAGYTALMDAIYLAMNQLRSARYQRRVILLISDGGENDSRYKTREIKELAEESGILIYAIRPFDALPMFRSLEEKLGNRTLSAISEATGGRTISLSFHDNVPAAAAAISLELRNQYLLGYHSTAPPRGDKWRKIKIRIAKPADGSQLQVHHRKAYFVEGR